MLVCLYFGRSPEGLGLDRNWTGPEPDRTRAAVRLTAIAKRRCGLVALPMSSLGAVAHRVVRSSFTRDAQELICLANEEYSRLRSSCMPQLPALDERATDGLSAAVEML
ncbi:hypothetical protein QJQ45_007309 [Haematococcus lacustris]|nr:hypothetical protein QJQ45_007309 [Haematococcus lacustris]